MSIEVRNISKTFGKFTALDNVSLTVKDGELVALLGPSGSGKTTLLRIIAGLEVPDAGSGAVLFHDEDVTRREVRQRQVGFVFQHYALFRHMTVFDNVAFGLTVRPRKHRPSKRDIADRVTELLRLVQLENLARRYPSQLSGGQRQRVALARALAVEPRVLLLDEPFGALDAKVRRELRRWLRRLHDEMGITSVFVTHDQEEALEVADRVAVMNAGKIEQLGTPEQVYDAPATPFMYNFLGNVNLFRGRLGEGGAMAIGDAKFDGAATAANGSPKDAVAYVRPHDIHITRHANGAPTLPVRVKHISAVGPTVRMYVDRIDNAETIEVELTRERLRELDPKVGDELYADLRAIKVFPVDYSI